MPPFFFNHGEHGGDVPEPGVPEDAVPALEALAANDGLRDQSLRRFEADAPPSYKSSEPEDFGYDEFLEPPPPPAAHDDHHHLGDDLPEDVVQTLERPLNEAELESIAAAAHVLLSPAEVFYADALREDERMPFSNSFREAAVGTRRQGLVVRHVLKNRWRKLGVWNPAWGFAGRNVTPADRYRDWRWPWEPQAAEDRDAVEENRKRLVLRALRGRQNLRRAEHVPGPPQAHLEPDSSQEEAEAFLITRPWFVFRLERFEDTVRCNRLDRATRIQYKGRLGPTVKERWQARGEWRREFNFAAGFEVERVASWKWRHESPSPEPEDLSCITKPLQSVGLRTYHNDLHFTPSEFDEIEVLERRMDKRPENSWIVGLADFDQPPIPGQVHRDVEDRDLSLHFSRTQSTAADGQKDAQPTFGMFGTGSSASGLGLFGSALNNESPSQQESTGEPGKPENPEDPMDLDEPSSKQSADDAELPAPRQSARASASRKREAEAPLPDPSPPKKTRRVKTATEVKVVLPAGAKRGRPAGRPRSLLDQKAEALLQQKKAEAVAAKKKKKKKDAPEKTPAARRGRPPKREQTQEEMAVELAKGCKTAAPVPALEPAAVAARRGRPPKIVKAAKPSVAVARAKQRAAAAKKVPGKRGRPARGQGAPADELASVAESSAPGAATPPKPRRGRPLKAQVQSQEVEEKATSAKATRRKSEAAAPEETAATPRTRDRPAKAASTTASATKKNKKETAPEEEVVPTPRSRGRPARASTAAAASGEVIPTPQRRGRPAKTTTPAASAATAEKKSEAAAPEEDATPRRGRPSKARAQEKTTANVATAALEKSKQQGNTTEGGATITPRRGRPSKASTAAAENAKTPVSEETATSRSRGRAGKPAVAAVSMTDKAKQPATEEGAVDTPKRRGRPARKSLQGGEDDSNPAATTAVNGATSAKKKTAATPNKKAAATTTTPQRASTGRVTKRTAVTNGSSKAKTPSTASPAGRGRGRPKKA
ncbi:uncharacterized protein PG986_015042 [Apiospora aurea]|uniref:Uncharacterized protein n=1 Tax=Apiospora aurea TaxID=335848 RepID=A0ABR1PRF4_9PEZI